MIKKILVADRGAIAFRILRTCHEMGIKTVAVYSNTDKNERYLQLADETVCIGPASLNESYLNAYNVLSAAFITKADAIHPGAGLLSKEPEFAKMCMKSNILWIGPAPSTMEKLSNSLHARRLAKQADVPVIQGMMQPAQTLQEMKETGERLGYPVLVKAAEGRYGQVDRKVNSARELASVYEQAKAEALELFGDGSLYMEKHVDNLRRIEVQVLCDHSGNSVHFFDRDSTLSTTAGMVAGEAPALGLTPQQRYALCTAALQVCQAAGYRNLGAVEFLLDNPAGRFYFSKVHPGLQESYGLTEMLTGIDLIKQQILVAAGERLSLAQNEIRSSGAVLGCSVKTGRLDGKGPYDKKEITFFHQPGGFQVRCDTAAYSGQMITHYSDPCIATLIVKGENRMQAQAKMLVAIEELTCEGIETNQETLAALLQDQDYMKGDFHTGTAERMNEGSKEDGFIQQIYSEATMGKN
ncbi:MAG: ATP-binding protein [Christensenellales bacterium]